VRWRAPEPSSEAGIVRRYTEVEKVLLTIVASIDAAATIGHRAADAVSE
jgi:hypothetical protein